MKTMKKTAAAGIALAATAGLVAGPVMSSVQAWADATYLPTTITIGDKEKPAADLKYKIVKIFNANKGNAETVNADKASDISWALSEADAKAVIGTINTAITEYNETAAEDKKLDAIADEATDATAIAAAKAIETIQTNKGDDYQVITSDLLWGIADDVKNVASIQETITYGSEVTGQTSGYFMLISADSSHADGQSATAPAFFLASGAQPVNPKTSAVPELTKTSTLGNHASAKNGDTISFTLTGTLPDNLSSYKAYQYKFTDTPSDNLEIKPDTVTVYAGAKDAEGNVSKDTDVTNKFTIAVNDGVLTVYCVDVIDIDGVNKDTVFTVDYDATLTIGNDQIGEVPTAQTSNAATLSYSNDPMTAGEEGEVLDEVMTDPENPENLPVNVYSYALQLYKDDATNGDPLAATFKVEGPNGFVKDDVTTVVNGDVAVIALEGLAAGEYTFTETGVPANHVAVEPFTVEIVTDYENATTAEEQVTLVLKDGDADAVALDDLAWSEDEEGNAIVSKYSGSITVHDPQDFFGLPNTGMSNQLILICAAGAVLVVGGVVGVAASRRKSGKEED